MDTLKITDDVIWLKHIAAGEGFMDKVGRLRPAQKLRLEVDGRSGIWTRMADGKDGRPTPGLKPHDDETRALWKTMQQRRGETVPVKLIEVRDPYLSHIQDILSEWDTKEDNEAFRDL